MSLPLVLITGATGHVGFVVLTTALKAGYRVRAAVRSAAKEKTIASNPYVQSLKVPASSLTFVTVPDLTSPGAYDSAVKDVEYIIHVASPIPGGDLTTQEQFEQEVIAPAIRGTLNMLTAAAKAPSVKRVVITSSAVGTTPFIKIMGGMERNEIANSESRTADPIGPYEVGGEMEAYVASKIKALNAAEAWMKENSPSFDLVHILPSVVLGRNDLAQSAKDTISNMNAYVLGAALGKKSEQPTPGSTVHIDDVARLHVEALNTEKIPAGSYIASTNSPRGGSFEGTDWQDINAIVAKFFPKEVEKGVLPNNGLQKSSKNRFDSGKTEKVFGWELQGFEEQVKSIVGQYVELSENA